MLRRLPTAELLRRLPTISNDFRFPNHCSPTEPIRGLPNNTPHLHDSRDQTNPQCCSDESTLDKDSSVHLIYHDPNDLRSLILIRIISKERTLRQSWIVNPIPWILDSGCWIPVFFTGTWILDSIPYWDSGFLEPYSGFQSPGFRIPQGKISRTPESGFPYKGR